MNKSRVQQNPEERAFTSAIAWSDLDDAERLLAKIIQHLRFGRIDCLPVRDGKLLLEPPPRVVARVNFGACADDEKVQVPLFGDLPPSFRALFDLVRRIRNGMLLVIHVKHGLPLAVEVERSFLDG